MHGASCTQVAASTSRTEETHVFLSRRTVALGTGVLAFLATASFYALGSGRSYDYDSSESVGAFIATPSLLDPFRRQLEFNNHPLFSFVDHVVYTMGGHSEAALRAFPITVAALTVGIVGFWAADRWGLPAGVAASAILATNPTYAELSRSVRGYSLLTFSAVVSTLLLARLLMERDRKVMIVYAVVVAVGIATHLYATFFLVGQIAVVVAAGKLNRAWLGAWLGSMLLGLVAYVGMADRMLTSAAHERGVFQPRFPAQAAHAILGSSPLAIALLAALALLGATQIRRREIAIGLGATAAAIAMDWVSSPRDLYPRFLVWLIPGVALFVAITATRSRLILPLVGVAVIAMTEVDARYWTTNPVPSLQAARTVQDARADGDRPCVFPDIRGALMGYTATAREVSTVGELSRCGIVLGGSFDSPHLRSEARETFRYRWILPAETPYIVYSRERPKIEVHPTRHASGAAQRTSGDGRRQ